MTFFNSVRVKYDDSPSVDAFGRARVSTPFTLFDSKQINGDNTLFWNTVTNGTGASSNDISNATVNLDVSNVGDYVIRQTKMRFSYQPGKSHQVIMTAANFGGEEDVQKRLGYYIGTYNAPHNATNGLFFSSDGYSSSETIAVNVAKNGAITSAPQSEWNLDRMDGTGPSGITADWSKTHIYVIDFQWLGVGRVRFGIEVQGVLHYIHEFYHANVRPSVYMQTPNLPVRYEIRSIGVGGVGTLSHICCSVQSEGGQEKTGTLYSTATGATHLDADTQDVIYAAIAMRLKATHLGVNVILSDLSVLAETNDSFRWLLVLNPTISGSLTYTSVGDNSGVERALGATANAVSNVGNILAQGYASQQSRTAQAQLATAIRLGSTIAGTRDVIALCVMPLANGADVQAAINWRELG